MGIAAKRMQPFTFLADGCPEGATAVCDMPDAMGPGTYTSMTTWYYAGMDMAAAEGGCLAQDGTFSVL